MSNSVPSFLTRVCLGLVLFGMPALAQAQNATPSNKLGWNQQGPDLPTVSAYTYKYYADSATVGVALTPTCTAFVAPDTSGFSCSVAFPAFTPGPHTLWLTASNAAGESAKSTPINFNMVLVPTAPASLRIQ